MSNAIGRRECIIGLGATVFAWPATAPAQQPSRQSATPKRIAVAVSSGNVSDLKNDPNAEVFDIELKRAGFVLGENLIIERYSAEGRPERHEALAREVASTQPDVIVSFGTALTLRFKAATSTIPIVALTGDPIRFGLVSSLAHPGRNITGVSLDAGVEVWGKRLELLGEAVPKLSKVLFVSTQEGWDGPGGGATREAAQKLGISLVRATVNSPHDEAEYRRVFSSIQRDQVDGIVLSDDPENYKYRFLLVQLIQQVRLPALYHLREQVAAGGLMAYSYDLKSALRRQAMQVAEVLRGANPADMPYFQETRFELVINLKTARELGLEIPAGLVAAATVNE